MQIPSFSQAEAENLRFLLDPSLPSQLLGSIRRDGDSPSASQISVPRPRRNLGFCRALNVQLSVPALQRAAGNGFKMATRTNQRRLAETDIYTRLLHRLSGTWRCLTPCLRM